MSQKILFVGDAAATGFGTVTWDLATRLLALGHDVRLISQNQTSDPIPHPLGERTWNPYGIHPITVTLRGFNDGWKPEKVIYLGDFASVRKTIQQGADFMRKAAEIAPIYHYCPIEGVDLPPMWAKVWEIFSPVAMTEFGADQIEGVTGIRPPMIYHGVNTEHFYPVSKDRPGRANHTEITSKADARKAFLIPDDRIIVLRTDRHMPRKHQNRLIRAFRRVWATDPRIDLVLHCAIDDQGGNLVEAKSKLLPHEQKRLILTGAHDTFDGLSREALNGLYNGADFYVQNSAEGFGLTPAEALACGLPVVAMDYATMPEILGAERRPVNLGPNGVNLDSEPYRGATGGTLVRFSHVVDNEYDHYWAAVDEEALADAVLRMAAKTHQRQEIARRAPRHIRETFSWDEAAAKFAALPAYRREPAHEEQAA